MRRDLPALVLLLTLAACGGGSESGTTTSTAAYPVYALAVAVQPSGARSATVFSHPPVIEIRDSNDHTATAHNALPVSMAILTGSGASGATLQGTTAVATDQGSATFGDLSIDRAGNGYQLVFSAPGFVSVISDPFDVAPPDGALIDPSTPPVSQVYFSVHSQQAVHAISPYIYGINGHDFDNRPAHLTLTRSGGNRLSAYNWETNASNAGSDWYNQNDAYLGGGDTPGGAVTPTIDTALAHGAGCIVTIPMLGYVAADKNGGGDVNQTNNFLAERFHRSYARKAGAFQSPPDTGDAAVYQDEWVHFLRQRYPQPANGPTVPLFFSLDNEPELWSSTHPRLRGSADGNAGQPIGYAELLERTQEFAAAIKETAPQALIFGPVHYGWQGMVDLQDAPDAGNRDFLEYYLQTLAAAEATHGRRLVDVLDVHWYPEARGGDVRITDDSGDTAVAAARMHAPRSLWDERYVEEGWITQRSTYGAIRLLPRLREKIDTHYPGTRLAITEYYYGGGNHISGAIAQADVLGIFGREGLFAATLWKLGSTDHRFIYGAFEIFRNYDGANGAFGNLSIQALSTDAANTSVYAAMDEGRPERMVLVCINKTSQTRTAGISVAHTVRFATAQVFALTAADSRPQRRGDIRLPQTNAFQYAIPAYSVSTLVLGP